MKKKCNVVMLASESPSQIYYTELEDRPTFQYLDSLKLRQDYIRMGYNPQHLYITSDDEIKVGDWYIHNQRPNGLRVLQYDGGPLPMDAKKVIASTDPELKIKTPNPPTFDYPYRIEQMPQIPESFIKEYARNPVNEVMVEYGLLGVVKSGAGTVILSPVEEKTYTKEEVTIEVSFALHKMLYYQSDNRFNTESQEYLPHMKNWIDSYLKNNL